MIRKLLAAMSFQVVLNLTIRESRNREHLEVILKHLAGVKTPDDPEAPDPEEPGGGAEPDDPEEPSGGDPGDDDEGPGGEEEAQRGRRDDFGGGSWGGTSLSPWAVGQVVWRIVGSAGRQRTAD